MRVTLTVDPCDVMVGIAWGRQDFVIKPFPFVVICVEMWDETPPFRLLTREEGQ